MAEIRKHKPSGQGPIAEALQAALGGAVRPVTPGEPTTKKTSAAPATSSGAGKPAFAVTALPGQPGWVSLPPEKAPVVAKKRTDEDDFDFED